jgi:hypothetical protein
MEHFHSLGQMSDEARDTLAAISIAALLANCSLDQCLVGITQQLRRQVVLEDLRVETK